MSPALKTWTTIQEGTWDQPPLEPNSWALLDSADWRGRHQEGVDKLKECFKGPYRVIQPYYFPEEDVKLEVWR
ncbi:uncharacterized protein PGTG_21119 [Puccinia graminis f. sp. tritici CRL 75-36-700-3]|uniref:Uncharacterized protein n=1 Tax=Puccinia graminis f. sp. tritici (strain CRL 75-36-700-3 / race SCCL) TaxID=418459 RepID=H6QQG2_PUCGT|nr:uncharacterized protein PGTG_21119 [Puccinia graminis f. sp. tritici CRL 75-36-700-3]EHS62573.1 hypothetical protein PGTG_21119 [Puccinia graminis f. sp. tritici CRL 75-36-700-3]